MQNTANYLMMYAIVSGIIGAVSCFMGYKIFKIVFSLIGFLVGLTAGVAIAQKIMPGNQMGIIICGLVGGIITSGIIKFFFKIGLFITGAWTAVITVSMLFSIYKKAATPQGIVIIAAFVGGVLAIILQKSMIMISTAGSGSWAMVTGISYFIPALRVNPELMLRAPEQTRIILGDKYYILLVAWIIFGISGYFYQRNRV